MGEKRCIHENFDFTNENEDDYDDGLGTWDYRITTESNWQKCQFACQQDWDCNFFTYVVQDKV